MAGGSRKNADTTIITAVAGGTTIRDAALKAGVSERTVFRRMQDPEFRRQVAGARAAMIAEATGILARASGAAVTTMISLLRSGSDTVRLGAARSILEFATKMRESQEFEARIAELEAAAAERTEPTTWRPSRTG